jgi:hypothetical protein
MLSEEPAEVSQTVVKEVQDQAVVIRDPVLDALIDHVRDHPKRGNYHFTDECLIRWYISRKENMEKTKKALSKFLEWRERECIATVTSEDYVKKLKETQVSLIGGPCTNGRPCIFIYARNHDKNEHTLDECKNYLVHVIEETLQKGAQMREAHAEDQAAIEFEKTLEGGNDSISATATESSTPTTVFNLTTAADDSTNTKTSTTTGTTNNDTSTCSKYKNIDTFTLIFDLEGFGMKCMNYDALSSLVNYCTWQYPCAMERVVIVNAPWIFNTCWSWIKSIIPTSAGNIVGFANNIDDLEVYVDRLHLPDEVTIHFD